MVRHVGASIVGSSTANFAGKFNNGSVDLAYAPAVAYEPLELYKGLGDKGGVFSYKVAQLTFQVVIDAEATIKEGLWMSPNAVEASGYGEMFRNVRIGLRDDGVYSAKMLTLMRKVRCSQNPTHAECAEKTE
jgi:hypothetical protein